MYGLYVTSHITCVIIVYIIIIIIIIITIIGDKIVLKIIFI